MSTAISHRGPDGAGTLVRENVALGHRRLSIIDLEGGRQPMATPDGQVHLTYNGEVYNYRELRRVLERKGYQFRTESDTEVILYAYEAWGKRCVEHFEGMFAFAIADFRKRELFLARDPFGIKPLLYRVDEKSFAFASEFQALQQLPDWTGEIDLYAIDLYLRYQYIPAPHTAYRKVFKLPAGHRMTVRMGEPFQKIETYWEPDFTHKKRFRKEELLVQLDDTLRDSVKRHLVADVPFGALLSGGIDSSLIVSYMAELLGKQVKTFAIGFDDEAVSELKYARIVAEKYGTDHHEEIVKFDAMETLPGIVKHFGEPFGDQSAIPTWAVSKMARSHVPMVLSGDGGDELFAGYAWYGGWLKCLDAMKPVQPTGWRQVAKKYVGRFLPSQQQEVAHQKYDERQWLDPVTRFQATPRTALWRSEFRFVTDRRSEAFFDAFRRSSDLADLNRGQLVDLESFLPENILRKVDIATMRFGLEVRPPILDRRVFDVAGRIHPDELYGIGNEGEYRGKLPLKALARQRFGSDFADRKKQGFVVPLEAWLRTNQQNVQEVRSRLCDTSTIIRQWFQPGEIEATLKSEIPENIWLLLVLEEWSQQNTTANAPAKSCPDIDRV